jgi:hypothetical protein
MQREEKVVWQIDSLQFSGLERILFHFSFTKMECNPWKKSSTDF